MTVKYIILYNLWSNGDKMPEWISGKKVSEEELKNSLNVLTGEVCFKCDTHSDKCPLANAAGEIKKLLEE